jgi:salicylate hydroxylase
VVRAQYVNDSPRVTGHVVYRAVVDQADFPDDLKWNAASLWAGPKCHLVHYPLRGGEQYNVVVTFHSRQQETWGVTDGSKEEVESYFQGICPKARQLIELPKTWKRWATADREPIGNWVFGRATILGDAAHPTTQYMAQGACMALEDAVTLGEALRVCQQNWDAALPLYQKNRIARTARIVLSGREMGRLYHAAGVERLVRNSLWKGRCHPRTTRSDRRRHPCTPLADSKTCPRITAMNSPAATWCRFGPTCARCCPLACPAATPAPSIGPTPHCVRC